MAQTTSGGDAISAQPPQKAAAGVDADRSPPPQEPVPPAPPETARAIFEPGLYLNVILVAIVSGLVLLVWLVAVFAGLKLLWQNEFVLSHSWMFPVICMPFSLVVGLLVKHLKAPTAMSESLTDSLAGDTSRVEWRRFPVSVLQTFASLFSGAALGPEGGLGLLASQVAAGYAHVLHIAPARRPKLIYASVASAYNGLLQNPIFAGVLGSEVAQTHRAGVASLPANLIGGAVGYAVFQLVGVPSLAGMLGLEPVEHIRPVDALLIVLMALLGVGLAAVAGVFFRVAEKGLGRIRSGVVRALIAGVIFSVAGYVAPIVMFSGESQVGTLVDDPAHYGVGLLLLIGVVKLALLAVGFRSGFLGGAIFPTVFALVSVALSIDLMLPEAEPTVLVAGLMVGFMVVMFGTPFMVILLVGFMLEASTDLLALIVLAVAVVLIVAPLLRLVASRRAGGPAAEGLRSADASRRRGAAEGSGGADASRRAEGENARPS